MKALALFGAFLLSIFLIKSFYEPTTPAQIKQAKFEKYKIAKLGLISKTEITKNLEEGATGWVEVHRVANGVVTFKTVVFEYQPSKFTTSLDVKHQDLKGKLLYKRFVYSQSKSMTIYRYGKSGKVNAKSGVTIHIDFKKTPNDQCFRNRYKLLDMPKSCGATVKVIGKLGMQRLKITPTYSDVFSGIGKTYTTKRLKKTDIDYRQKIKKYLDKTYKEAQIVKKLKEPRI